MVPLEPSGVIPVLSLPQHFIIFVMAKLIIQIKKGFVLVEINETMERKNVFNDKIIFIL